MCFSRKLKTCPLVFVGKASAAMIYKPGNEKGAWRGNRIWAISKIAEKKAQKRKELQTSYENKIKYCNFIKNEVI